MYRILASSAVVVYSALAAQGSVRDTGTAVVERPGTRVALRACDPHGADGTRLAGHAKAYVPLDVEPSRARFGFVFVLATGGDGRVMAWLAAYGERHPPPGVRSVYERAHKRLHGRYPDQ